MKTLLFKILSGLFGVGLFFVGIEILLRFLPVKEYSPLLPVNEKNPIWRYEPHRTFIWSKGWNFSIVNRVRTNNYGFVSDIDYDNTSTVPLIAVIGDSYVEAIMVTFRETLAGRLAEHLKDTFRVYSFARSGAPLSQYLIYAEYAKATFKPSGLVIVVVGNDFDESLMEYAYENGHHHFLENTEGELVLKRNDYSPGFSEKIARISALARYLWINLGLKSIPQRIRYLLGKDNPNGRYVGQTLSAPDPIRTLKSKRAIDTFFKKLPSMSGLDPSKILFVIDGIRPHLYNEETLREVESSYVNMMRDYFMTSGRTRGYEVIDLQPHFIDHYRRYRSPFEYPTDGHWNEIGHKVVFEATIQSRFLMDLKGTEISFH